MTTSSFAIAGRHERAVAISRSVPGWYRGRRYLPLAPCWPLVRCKDQARFEHLYEEKVLSKLDPHQVAASVGARAILLCYEAPGQFCHRQLVARWLRRAGFHVREWKGGAR